MKLVDYILAIGCILVLIQLIKSIFEIVSNHKELKDLKDEDLD